jgi:hypothetical protein
MESSLRTPTFLMRASLYSPFTLYNVPVAAMGYLHTFTGERALAEIAF